MTRRGGDGTATAPKGLKLLGAAFTNRKIGVMLLFGFAAGLPYALLLGTLYAWLSEAEVDLETMGVFSLIGLAYAFKFLWSPIVDGTAPPGLRRLGRRKSWIVPAQFLVAAVLVLLSLLNPQTNLGWFSLLAGVGAFASATQDIAIDAWRVDVADEVATLDILSTVYQLGYRIAALAGGALALVAAERLGWPAVYLGLGLATAMVAVAGLVAPDNPWGAIGGTCDDRVLAAGELKPSVRRAALALVGALWAGALIVVIAFMVLSLGAVPEDRPDSGEFIKVAGPLIVIATVIVPAIVAAVLDSWRRSGRGVLEAERPLDRGWERAVDHGYRALIEPLGELVGRLRWASVLVLGLILSYRITDSIWGPFALPFYLDELGYTNDQVAVASKFFGVGMTMLGITLSAVFFASIGRMATVTLGAVIAAASNLIYADLASGGASLDAVGRTTGFYALLETFGADERLARLMLAISGENIAGGIAGAAFVAYLSAIVSKRYSAVQYALLSSLTFLVGSLGRGALGGMIKTNGYASVFVFTATIGVIAIVLSAAEWARERRNHYRSVEPPITDVAG